MHHFISSSQKHSKVDTVTINFRQLKKQSFRERKKNCLRLHSLWVIDLGLKLWLGCPWRLSGKESSCQCRRHSFNPWFNPGSLEDPTCSCATTSEPESLNYRAHMLTLLQLNHPRACAQQQTSHCNEKPAYCNWRVAPARHH